MTDKAKTPLDLAPIRARAEAATPTVQQIESLLREHANALMEEARFETLATSERVADTADPLCREIRSLAHQHAAANDDRVALLAEVARLAEEVERLRADLEVAESRKSSVIRDMAAEVERLRGRVACARAYDINDVGIYTFGERWRAIWPDGSERIFHTLDAAWTALDAARRGEAGQGGGE